MTLTTEQLAKNDEEFEAMMAVKYPFHSLGKLSNGSYIDRDVWHLNRGWKLHQESLVVELPLDLSDDGDCERFWRKDVVTNALQSAGINYREKE